MGDFNKLMKPKVVVTAGNKDVFATATDIIWGYIIDKAGQSVCLLYTSPSPRDLSTSRMPSSA